MNRYYNVIVRGSLDLHDLLIALNRLQEETEVYNYEWWQNIGYSEWQVRVFERNINLICKKNKKSLTIVAYYENEKEINNATETDTI